VPTTCSVRRRHQTSLYLPCGVRLYQKTSSVCTRGFPGDVSCRDLGFTTRMLNLRRPSYSSIEGIHNSSTARVAIRCQCHAVVFSGEKMEDQVVHRFTRKILQRVRPSLSCQSCRILSIAIRGR
jgi:hypothetical protein